MRPQFSIKELCEAFGISRSGYHGSRQRAQSRRARSNAVLVEKMALIHGHRHMRAYGSPRMTRQLQALGLSCSRNRVARLMRAHGLRARPRKPFRPKTTQPDHAAHPSPNLLAQAGAPTAPGTHLASDITYIATAQGWLYLAVVIDLFSRAIVGWKLSDSLHSELVTDALSKALQSGLVKRNAIFHSDRGCQYSSTQTRRLLAKAELRQSMSAAGYCYDNAFVESLFASLKSETLPQQSAFETKTDAARCLFDYLETFYNHSRLHSALNYQSPKTFLDHHFHSATKHLN
jgi:transposase InsO family protein